MIINYFDISLQFNECMECLQKSVNINPLQVIKYIVILIMKLLVSFRRGCGLH